MISAKQAIYGVIATVLSIFISTSIAQVLVDIIGLWGSFVVAGVFALMLTRFLLMLVKKYVK
jgi:hypothetical protein